MDVPECSGGCLCINGKPSTSDSSCCDHNTKGVKAGLLPTEGATSGRYHCLCAQRLQRRQTRVAFLVSAIAVLVAVLAVVVAVYAVYINKTSYGPQSCGLSAEDKRLLQELRSLRSMLVQRDLEDEASAEAMEPKFLHDPEIFSLRHLVKRQVETTTKSPPSGKHKKRRGKKGKKGRKKNRGTKNRCKKYEQCFQDSKSKSMRAGHYIPKFWNDRSMEEYKDGGPIKFFHEADWLDKNSNIHAPAKQQEDGTFEILDSGLYLLYSSVLFYDSRKKQSQAIEKNGNRLFRCMEGVDYLTNDGDKLHNSKYKTCSVTGVTYLNKGDKITVSNLYDNTIIDMSNDTTFFGLVQLVEGVEIKR